MQVTVGRIGRPHGVRGDVVVGVRTDEPELRFARGSRLDTDPPTLARSPWPATVAFGRVAGPVRGDQRPGRRRRTARHLAAGRLRHARRRPRTLTSSATPTWSASSVRTVDGTAVGTVDDVLHSGQDVLAIKPAAGARREIMIPFVKAIVPEVDMPGGCLAIDPPEGLLNLEDAMIDLEEAGRRRSRPTSRHREDFSYREDFSSYSANYLRHQKSLRDHAPPSRKGHDAHRHRHHLP